MSIIKYIEVAVAYTFAFVVLLASVYVLLRVCTKAIANSWYEVKFKKDKEVYHDRAAQENNETEEEEEYKPIQQQETKKSIG